MNVRQKGLIIRDAHPEELDDVAQLIKESYAQFRAALPPGAWQEYVADMMDVRSRLGVADLIVAKLDGGLAGSVTLYLNGKDSYHETWPEGWAAVRLLAVRPACRGAGIGRALMEECVRRCHARGIKTIGLHTTEMMAVALHMYEKMGFRRAPELDFHPAPDHVVMAYRLDLNERK